MSVDIENDGRALEQNLGRKSGGESCNDSCSCRRNGQSQPGSGITNGRDGGNERAEDGNIPQKKDFSYTCTNISNTLEKLNIDDGCEEIQQTVYDNIRNIMDPEKPSNLEDLNVVNEEDVFVSKTGEDEYHIKIIFVPTVPHCSLAPLIGLCMRSKLRKTLVQSFKLDIFIKDGTHDTAAEINKQINDKERISAAMENPNLKKIVEQCIQEEY